MDTTTRRSGVTRTRIISLCSDKAMRLRAELQQSRLAAEVDRINAARPDLLPALERGVASAVAEALRQ